MCEPLYYSTDALLGAVPFMRLGPAELQRHWAGRALVFAWAFAVPCALHGLAKGLCFGLVPYVSLGFLFFAFSQALPPSLPLSLPDRSTPPTLRTAASSLPPSHAHARPAGLPPQRGLLRAAAAGARGAVRPAGVGGAPGDASAAACRSLNLTCR
jgi:hypothetical protein